ncbi:exported hypothetical protein [Candidatus Zixiibacteriota bacterium]|nr:exported hypothetical protein [candidate division Zixibacteria bacterium]
MRNSRIILFLIVILMAGLMPLLAENPPAGQADSTHIMTMERPRLDGLKQFHDVVRPIWHTYLPEKNYKAIRESVEPFQKSVQILMEAPIPDYFQHKKEQIEAGRKAIADAIAAFDTVAKKNDDAELEKAVENAHTAFENLVRVISPRMAEIDNFHLVLYPLWHKALPASDWTSIKATAPVLRTEMDSLMAAPIPEWAKEKDQQINEQRTALNKAVTDFCETCKANKDEEIKDKLTILHQHFMALDGVFE